MLAALAVTTACDDDDDDDNPTGPDNAIIASIQTDAHILAAVHESNMGEIDAGTLALERASDTQVLAFAQMMIDDHTTLDEQGVALAALIGVTPALPDQRLPELQAQEIQTLSATAAGPRFDQVYIAQQITAHERTVDLVDVGIERASSAEVRTLLQQARPTIVAHLEEARDIQAIVGQP